MNKGSIRIEPYGHKNIPPKYLSKKGRMGGETETMEKGEKKEWSKGLHDVLRRDQ